MTSQPTIFKLPAQLNSIDREAIQKFINDWRWRHGELRACHANWEVHEDGKVRWFPAKVIDLHFADAYGQLRINTETGNVTVVKNPDNKPGAPPVLKYSKPDVPVYGLTPPTR
jgi:hypothetical protein